MRQNHITLNIFQLSEYSVRIESENDFCNNDFFEDNSSRLVDLSSTYMLYRTVLHQNFHLIFKLLTQVSPLQTYEGLLEENDW